MLEMLERLGKAFPFKRVYASAELLDRFNKQFGVEMTQFAITVDSSANISEDELFTLMVDSRKHN